MTPYSGPVPVMGSLLEINQHLVVACCWPTCRHEVRLSAVMAVKRFGFNCTMAQAKRRAVCSRCGATGRENRIDVYPCTLDLSAWSAREKHASEPRDYTAEHLADTLFTLTKLLGGKGELGGDGPVKEL